MKYCGHPPNSLAPPLLPASPRHPSASAPRMLARLLARLRVARAAASEAVTPSESKIKQGRPRCPGARAPELVCQRRKNDITLRIVGLMIMKKRRHARGQTSGLGAGLPGGLLAPGPGSWGVRGRSGAPWEGGSRPPPGAPGRQQGSPDLAPGPEVHSVLSFSANWT